MKFHCPICKKPTDSDANAEFPFCSERCKLLDLGAWASEYRYSENNHRHFYRRWSELVGGAGWHCGQK